MIGSSPQVKVPHQWGHTQVDVPFNSFDSLATSMLNSIQNQCRPNSCSGFSHSISKNLRSSGIMFFIMAGGFYLAALLIKDGTADFEGAPLALISHPEMLHGWGRTCRQILHTWSIRDTFFAVCFLWFCASINDLY